MKTWHDKIELLEAVTKARAEARDTVPRHGGTDMIEAAMFLAAMHALDTWASGQPEAEAGGAPGTAPTPALAPPEIVPGEDIPEGEGNEGDVPVKLPEVNYDR